ncbi:MAG: hypothetical protein ACK4FM_02120 [Caldimicrobium sp.]
MFLTLHWIKNLYQIYNKRGFLSIQEKKFQFTPKLFLASLLQLYKLSLWEKIAKVYFGNLTLEEKELVEKGFSYLLAQDLLSLEFAPWFRDNLLGRDFTFKGYVEVTYEFSQLKEQVNKQVRIPLLNQLKKISMAIEEDLEGGREISEASIKKLCRIYIFFKVVEKITSCSRIELLDLAEKLILKLKMQPLYEEILIEMDKGLRYILPDIEKNFERELQKLIEEAKIS